jgi:cell division protein FtsB
LAVQSLGLPKGKFHGGFVAGEASPSQVLAMWQATAEAQNKELTQLRNEVVALRQRIECLENTIQVLEAENATLRQA